MSSHLFPKQLQQQQFGQDVDTTRYDREEEYLEAQRAAVEATMIGRETLEVATRQGEQLQNAENLADETEYKLDRATRVLRGMTWAGWWANKFSQDVEPPEYKTTDINNVRIPPKVYDHAPPKCAAAAQAVQNYHANLQVLETCETLEQQETCQVICDNMFQHAKRQVTALHRQQELHRGSGPRKRNENGNEDEYRGFPDLLSLDLKILLERQDFVKEAMRRGAAYPKSTVANCNASDKSALFGEQSQQEAPPPAPSLISSPILDPIQQQQDNHLDFMSRHLNELGSLASNLSSTLTQQGETLESLDGKSENMLFKTKMVTRRADRMIQKKSWTRTKTDFLYHASIRHVASGKYLAVSSSHSSLVLSEKFNETCIFGIWQRQTGSKVFGMQSKYSNRWVGQNLLGNLVCSAYSFDRREEWDSDSDDWSRTALLCASAGWGNGGYVMVRKEDQLLTIGGGGLLDKKNADIWCIQEHGQTTATGTNGASSATAAKAIPSIKK